MKKTYYYHEDEHDDFGKVGHNNKKIKTNYKYLYKNVFIRFLSFLFYYFIAFPVLYVFSRLFLLSKIENRKALKELKHKPYFIYANHTHYIDAYLMQICVSFPRRTYIISHQDPLNIPVGGKLIKALGALPLPNDIHSYKKFSNAIKTVMKRKQAIVIFPEGTLWPYYTSIRKMNETSFKYPAMHNAPLVVVSETYVQRKIFKKAKPRMKLKISSPIYPDKNKSINENQHLLYDKAMAIWEENVKNKDNYSYNTYIKIDEQAKTE